MSFCFVLLDDSIEFLWCCIVLLSDVCVVRIFCYLVFCFFVFILFVFLVCSFCFYCDFWNLKLWDIVLFLCGWFSFGSCWLFYFVVYLRLYIGKWVCFLYGWMIVMVLYCFSEWCLSLCVEFEMCGWWERSVWEKWILESVGVWFGSWMYVYEEEELCFCFVCVSWRG